MRRLGPSAEPPRPGRVFQAIRSAGGVPVATHPNLTWAVDADDLVASRGYRLFEVWNAEPGMHNLGGGGTPSTEEMWDHALTAGRTLYGVAVDDSHHFHDFGSEWANPGRAWVMVRAPELSEAALLAALEAGDFYATTGVHLGSYRVDGDGLRIEIAEETGLVEWLEPGRNPTRYRTAFIGRGGAVLKTDESLRPAYTFRGDELYVRARIEASTGAVAWTQPVFDVPRAADGGGRGADRAGARRPKALPPEPPHALSREDSHFVDIQYLEW